MPQAFFGLRVSFALEILDSPWPLDLLITDIFLITDALIRNSVNGFALARMARLRRPDLKILYMTGSEIPAEEDVGGILHKRLPLEMLTPEARQALGEGVDRSG